MEKNLKATSSKDFYEAYGIKQEFSTPKTLQHNGVVEQKNRTIQDMIRVMLTLRTWHTVGAEAVNILVHIINRIYPRPMTDKTTYEIWNVNVTVEDID